MPDLFAEDIHSVRVPCSNCGATVELANTGLEAFGSSEGVLCLECLVLGNARVGGDGETASVPIQERIALIDTVVATFAAHLRTVLVRNIKSDLNWNSAYGFESWDDPADALAAAHAPGIWYALRPRETTPHA
jgi:hypothetical protein